MLNQQERIELQVILTDNDKPNNYKSTFCNKAVEYIQWEKIQADWVLVL